MNIVNVYPLNRFEIRFERKFPIRRFIQYIVRIHNYVSDIVKRCCSRTTPVHCSADPSLPARLGLELDAGYQGVSRWHSCCIETDSAKSLGK